MADQERFRFYALWLCLVCIVVFVLQILFSGFTDLFVLNASAYKDFQVWRFVTAIFLHGGLAHLVLNLFALALFGSIAERLVGSKRFIFTFFVAGILANLVSVGFYDSSLGASGAIFGVIGLIIIVRPLMTVWAFGLPMPMFLAGALWIIGDLIGAYGFIIGNPLDSTGNIAHLTGVAVGLVCGLFFRDWNPKKKEKYVLRADEDSIRRWEDFYLK